MGGGGLHSYLFCTPNTGGQQTSQNQSSAEHPHEANYSSRFAQVFRSDAYYSSIAWYNFSNPTLQFTIAHVHTTWLLQTQGLGLPCIRECTCTWRARTWVGVACTHTCSAHQILVISKQRKNRAQQNTHMVQIVACHSDQITKSNASIHKKSCSHNTVAANTRLGFTLHS